MNELFTPGRIGGLTLPNRFIRAGCFEGMAQGGNVTDALIAHHRDLAAGGCALTTVGYCAVSKDGRGFGHELWMRDELVGQLRQLTDAVHEAGGRASIQLVHCGFFSSPRVTGTRPLGASRKLCLFRLSICDEMTQEQIRNTTVDFADTACRAKEAGFDAVEIHAGHGYLLSQFLSPWTNRRTDEWGGLLENRLRFPVDVLRAVRAAVGPDFPILVKMNQMDGMKGGLVLADALPIARAFEQAGASALIPSCGFTAKTPFMMLRGKLPVREMVANQREWIMKLGLTLFGRLFVQYYPFEPVFLLDGARQIAKEVSIPVVYIGGITSAADAQRALDAGCTFVQIGRATVRDPAFVRRLQNATSSPSDCDHCNRCIGAMDGGGVACLSAREGSLPALLSP
jgi:2,4-dienoyl-CoA reductase-like NADH-dependent reductase (Old Yellow Enzyme family)